MNPRILLLMGEKDSLALWTLDRFMLPGPYDKNSDPRLSRHFTFLEYTGAFDEKSVLEYLKREAGKFDAIAIWEVGYEDAKRTVEQNFPGPKILVCCGGWYEPPPGMYLIKAHLPIFKLSDFDHMVEEAFRDL